VEEVGSEEEEQVINKEIIGRDQLLSREIFPRLKKAGFIITGQRGIGKTEVLKWAYHHYEGEKLYVSCNDAYGEIIKSIAKKQGIVISKKVLSVLEKEIMKSDKVALFIDDIEKMKPKQAIFFTAWNGWNAIFLAGVEPFREEARKLLWGKHKIKVRVLDKEKREELARYILEKLGCLTELSVIAQESRGIPGRAWAIAKGEFVRDDDERVQGEEINIAPVQYLFIVAIMCLRYISLGLGEKDLYIMAGLGMGLAYILRHLIKVTSR